MKVTDAMRAEAERIVGQDFSANGEVLGKVARIDFDEHSMTIVLDNGRTIKLSEEAT